MSRALLQVDQLTLALPPGADRDYAVRDVSFTVGRGEVLALIGESGSGKSVIGQAIMGLSGPGVQRRAGDVLLDGLS